MLCIEIDEKQNLAKGVSTIVFCSWSTEVVIRKTDISYTRGMVQSLRVVNAWGQLAPILFLVGAAYEQASLLASCPVAIHVSQWFHLSLVENLLW